MAASGFWSAVQCLVAPRAFPGPHFVLFLGEPRLNRWWALPCSTDEPRLAHGQHLSRAALHTDNTCYGPPCTRTTPVMLMREYLRFDLSR